MWLFFNENMTSCVYCIAFCHNVLICQGKMSFESQRITYFIAHIIGRNVSAVVAQGRNGNLSHLVSFHSPGGCVQLLVTDNI